MRNARSNGRICPRRAAGLHTVPAYASGRTNDKRYLTARAESRKAHPAVPQAAECRAAPVLRQFRPRRLLPSRASAQAPPLHQTENRAAAAAAAHPAGIGSADTPLRSRQSSPAKPSGLQEMHRHRRHTRRPPQAIPVPPPRHGHSTALLPLRRSMQTRVHTAYHTQSRTAVPSAHRADSRRASIPQG